MKSGVRKFIVFWIPVIGYCVAIFTLSSMSQPLPLGFEIRYLDKLLHAIEYGILCYLLIRAITGTQVKLTRKAVVISAVLLVGLYGASDEFHQMFVPGRCPDIVDFLADFLGAAVVGVMKR